METKTKKCPAFFCTGSGIEYFSRNGEYKLIEIPRFDIPEFMCSQYARLCLEKLFPERARNFQRGSVWNLRYNNPVMIAEPDLSNAQSGQLVTFYNPQSKFNSSVCGEKDIKGNNRIATHIGLLLDFNSRNQALILHQFGVSQMINDLDTLKLRKGLEARELIGIC